MKKGIHKSKSYVLRVIILAVLISVSGILLARAFYSSEPDKRISGHNHASKPTLPFAPCRGNIYDRSYRELAVNANVYSVYAHPLDVDNPDQTVAALSNILKIDKEYLLKVLKCERAFIWIARRVTPKQAEMIKNLGLKGIHFVNENYRVYPRNNLAAQVIGFVDSDGHGVEGLELAYDHLLGNTPLSLQNRDEELTPPVLNEGTPEVSSHKGSSMVLTLDANIQALAEKELGQMSAKQGFKAGAITVLDVETGALLAMASYPSYDPNTFWEAKAAVRRNRPIADTYELGELIRIFANAAALEERGAKEKTILVPPESNSHKTDAAQDPSPEFFYNFLLGLGFGNRLGVSLPTENSGTLPPYGRYKEDAAALYRGEGITVTPLQIIAAFGAVLNRGQLMLPQVVMKITDNHRNLINAEQGILIRQVCSAETSDKIRAALAAGPGPKNKKEKGLVFLTACKHMESPDDSSPDDPSIDKSRRVDYIRYFLGGAPADNPRVAVLAVTEAAYPEEESGIKIEGSMKHIVQASMEVLNGSSAKVLVASYPGKKQRLGPEKNKAEKIYKPSPSPTAKTMLMPDVCGKSMREAMHMLQGYDVSLVVTGSGVAIRQSPAPGTSLRKMARCIIEFKPSL